MKKLLFFAAFICSQVTFAQDFQLSQYYQSPLYLNPGFTGITPQQRVVLNHRVQWPNLPQAFVTSVASYDLFVNQLRSGFGLIVSTDKMGSAGWRTNNASLLYSYKVKITEKLVFSPGLSFGYGQNGLDRSKVIMGDQLQYNGESTDAELRKLGQHSYFDFGSGFLLYTRKWWVGAAFSHMNRPNLSVLNEVSRLPMKTAFHAGVKINLNSTVAGGRSTYLTPSFIYRKQGDSFTQFDIGVNYHVDPVSVGLWYRGKPTQKSVINSVQQDALILYLGLYLKQFTVGYSYDFTVSELQTSSGGAHELSIVWEFRTKSTSKNEKKKYRLIPCPTFNSKEGFWN
jgi:type IX secretion system PorP/SprF family membrane protein